ncbi:acetate--CoA ligase family protein [Saccharopolyspora erythraea]|uniref:acetate--CoA ligase family protein n=1 Tax=Saccharopolyspora erythraea TaxID=1836 RepID=UPI001BA6DB33|nr:acetate--CoA ligase family protein [Saccharopolyspora erythraea]QUH03600.1 acetate--CoA ligase family protein [Saccharopolyspora erythraea]
MAAHGDLRRLLAPERVAVVGGEAAAEAVRQCRRIGFGGEIWPVHPRRTEIAGLDCHPDVASLPGVPDAAFVAVPGQATVQVVAELAALGCGGAVCHASGFAEHGGAALQQSLVAAAGTMPLIGPNCIGTLNYLDGVALWPDQHGGLRVDSGVAVITQSGNIGQNLTMQRRSLPLAQLVTLGNAAVTGVADLVAAMLEDPRITAIGLHLEGIDDAPGLAEVALEALRRRVPVVVLKSGSSELGARANLSHTSSLAGPDVLCDALFRRCGMARVHEIGAFVETLKFLHVHGALAGTRFASASCSGGEAALVADLADERGLPLPEFPEVVGRRLRRVLGDRVAVANPLDYHTYVWGRPEELTECFTAFLGAGFDTHLLMLDFPREDRCSDASWSITADAYVEAHRRTGASACVVSWLPEGMPEAVGDRLLGEGIAPMQGVADCLDAIGAAARIGAAQGAVERILPVRTVFPVEPAGSDGVVHLLDEWSGKRALAEHGLPVPPGVVTGARDAAAAASGLGFPVVVKALGIAHKSDVGGVRVGLTDEHQVREAVAGMGGVADRFLVERMVGGAVAELIVGVRRDPRFGLALTLGAGGVLVELVGDAVTLLLPASPSDVRDALRGLRIWPLLAGFRGPGADVDAVVDAVGAIADYASAGDDLVELDVNPLLALPEGTAAVDVLIRRRRGGKT